MPFRDLFFKTTMPTPAEPEQEQPEPRHVKLQHVEPQHVERQTAELPSPPSVTTSAPTSTVPQAPPEPSPAPLPPAPGTVSTSPSASGPIEAQPPKEQPPDDGPIHIPHRGPAPFRPQTDRAPDHSPPQGTDQATSLKMPAPPPSLRAEPRIPQPASTLPHVTTPSSKAATAAPLQSHSEAEVRERPREKRGVARPRIPRHSSGWAAMLQHLKEEPSLRVLDIGPTSPNNINFLTNMGHSVYMADIVQDAIEGKWGIPSEDGKERYDVERFYDQNFHFGDRRFEVVLLWTTIDYLPEAFIPSLVERLKQCMEPGGKLLAFFHTRSHGADTTFCRYHLVDSSEILVQEGEPYPVQRVYTNREIERTFKAFSGCRFFLARDNVYEVIITR